mgnify:CR=1 FL=1
MKKPKVIDLFAGCGGFSRGFEKAGFDNIISNDIWEPAGNTFMHNHKSGKFIIGDITQANVKKDIINDSKGCHVIVGGPPCQAYSMAGIRNVDDPRGKLFEDYLKIVKKIQPKYFVIENVKGLLTMEHDKPGLNPIDQRKLNKIKKLEKLKTSLLLKRKQSLNTSKIKFTKSESKILEETKQELKEVKKNTSYLRVKVTDMIKKRFERIGYDVKMEILNAANFGVPQKRERVIFIGSLDGLPIRFPDQTYKQKTNDNEDIFKSNLSDWITVREAIDDIKNIPENIDFNHIFTKCGKDFLRKIKKTKIGTSVYKGYSDAYFRSLPDEPSRTVKENHGGVFIHYEKDRFMTPRELARLQSFEDDFIFKGSKSQILVQIGNAVPPKLGFEIAECLLN